MNRSFTLEIEKMVYGGRGMGRVDGKVVFVPFTAPGDRVCVEVVRERKDYIEAVTKTVEQESPLRVRPFCGFFGKCGGCQYQHISYPHQLKLKEKEVRDSLLRQKGDKDLEVLPAIPSPHDRGYRIRAQFKGDLRSQREVLGFYGMKSHDLVDLRECPLLHPLANEILKGLKNWLGKRREFLVRGADIQISPDENKGVVRLQVEGNYRSQMAEIAGKEIPGVKGVVLGGKKKISWGELTLLYRCPEIFGRRSLQIQADYDSFTQVNPYQNWKLVKRVVEWADPSGRENIVDLFCGSGNLTLPMAQRAGKVWGIDQDERAIKNAAENARKNRIENCFFIPATASGGIRRILVETDSVDVVVLDPPRAGAKEVLDAIVRMKPRKIIYVSCEPPTLARDLRRLGEMGFRLRRIQPLDMFPHTYHIEVIAELSANSYQPSAISAQQRRR
jgi:23S rRNA (uracil1939-C5)-methyltransferase